MDLEIDLPRNKLIIIMEFIEQVNKYKSKIYVSSGCLIIPFIYIIILLEYCKIIKFNPVDYWPVIFAFVVIMMLVAEKIEEYKDVQIKKIINNQETNLEIILYKIIFKLY